MKIINGKITDSVGGIEFNNTSNTASGDYSIAGGSGNTASSTGSFIHSTNSVVSGARSAVIGGQNITGSTADTVYVPNLNVTGTITYGTGNSYTTKVLPLGDWNMLTTAVISLSHGLSSTELISMVAATGMVRRDDDTIFSPIGTFITGSDGVYIINFQSGQVYLGRGGGGSFATSDYDSTSFNRGWISFTYIPD